MANGYKTGGRVAGTPNKKTEAVKKGLTALMDRLGYDPYEAMVEMARDAETPQDVRFQIHRTLIEYTYPKKLPVEGSADEESRRITLVVE